MGTIASQITSLTIVYSTVYSDRSKQTSKLHVTGLCVGNSPGTGEFPAQMASNAQNVSIWWRHHVFSKNKMGPRAVFVWIKVVWWHQGITWSKVDVSSVRSSNSHLRVISQHTPQPSIVLIRLKNEIIHLKFNSNLPGNFELITNLNQPLRTENCLPAHFLCLFIHSDHSQSGLWEWQQAWKSNIGPIFQQMLILLISNYVTAYE